MNSLHVATTKAAPCLSPSSFKDASLYQSPGSKCKPCPVVHPVPVCGSDGHTYSSQVPPDAFAILSSAVSKAVLRTDRLFYSPCPHSVNWNTSRASRARRSWSSVRGCVPALLRLSPARRRRRKVPGSAHCPPHALGFVTPTGFETAPNLVQLPG